MRSLAQKKPEEWHSQRNHKSKGPEVETACGLIFKTLLPFTYVTLSQPYSRKSCTLWTRDVRWREEHVLHWQFGPRTKRALGPKAVLLHSSRWAVWPETLDWTTRCPLLRKTQVGKPRPRGNLLEQQSAHIQVAGLPEPGPLHQPRLLYSHTSPRNLKPGYGEGLHDLLSPSVSATETFPGRRDEGRDPQDPEVTRASET